nr:uncharacterized protein CI109_006450 [Kwoniella shandongensis]KAA5525181.1 hypothetical protein CI109_006450 [Kwoniella shandongensis]
MPTPLGQANSFNSSGATIVPDHRNSSSHNTRSTARGLVPQASFDARLASAIGVNPIGNDMIGLLHNQHVDYPSDWSSFPEIPIRNNNERDFSLPSSQESSLPTIQLGVIDSSPSPGPDDENMIYDAFRDDTMSDDASITGTETDSYSTTDMDTDDDNHIHPHSASQLSPVDLAALDRINISTGTQQSPPIMTFTPYAYALKHIERSDNHTGGGGNSAISPSALNQPVVSPDESIYNSISSPAEPQTERRSSAGRPPGSTKKRGGVKEEGEKLDKVAHRRDINRRSAQKHRLRRKQEMDELKDALDAALARVRQLEQDLAVSNAIRDQLAAVINNGRFGEMVGAGRTTTTMTTSGGGQQQGGGRSMRSSDSGAQ